MRKRWKRKSGWVTPNLHDKRKVSELIKECLEPQRYYDEWEDWRDGMRTPRHWDQTKIKHKKERKECKCEICVNRRNAWMTRI